MAAIHDALARNIRALAEKRGIPLSILADRAAVSRRQLFSVLSGEYDATVGWLAKLADVLECTVADLLAEK